ncbi:MAG: hypothetical protein ACSLFM_10885 [Tepidiformaceae bacterium]
MALRRLRLLIPVLAVATAGVIGGAALWDGLRDGGTATAEDTAGQLARRALDPAECASARSMLQNTQTAALDSLRESGASSGTIELMTQDYAESLAWAAGGCPEDPVRGFVETAQHTFYFQLLGRTPEEYGLGRIEFASPPR